MHSTPGKLHLQQNQQLTLGLRPNTWGRRKLGGPDRKRRGGYVSLKCPGKPRSGLFRPCCTFNSYPRSSFLPAPQRSALPESLGLGGEFGSARTAGGRFEPVPPTPAATSPWCPRPIKGKRPGAQLHSRTRLSSSGHLSSGGCPLPGGLLTNCKMNPPPPRPLLPAKTPPPNKLL